MTRKIAEEGANSGRGPRLRAIRLRDKKDARRLIARCVNDLYRRVVSAEVGGKVLYAASVFIKSIETDEAKWAAGSDAQPSPAMIAAKIREAMREANGQVPGPPGAE